MKKIIAVVLCAAFALAMTSCGSTDETRRTRRDDDEIEETYESKKDKDSDETESVDTEPVETETVKTTPSSDLTEADTPAVMFSTTDRDGNSWDESVFASAQVTMINFWEPWCGPCVGEIPDLELLYENYSGKGLQIIGVYSETTMEGDVDDILSGSGVTYPILHYTGEFDQFQTGYVPTTIFVDQYGHIITLPNGDTNVIGSQDYEAWAELIDSILN